MQTNTLYNLSDSVRKVADRQLTEPQLIKLKNHEQYLKKNKIHQICNELLAKLLETRPQKVKQEMIQILKKQKDVENAFFRRLDFQYMFDSFDIFDERGSHEISKQYLIQALKYIDITYTIDQLQNRYHKLKLQSRIKKNYT